jgi:glycosyltransferase involved in cell wall biosynthesis
VKNEESSLKVGYIVKMFPRLSETFILNEILELERRGVAVTIFSLKKPNEGRFHPQLSQLKAKVHYLDELDPKRWAAWLGREWPHLEPYAARLWSQVEAALGAGDPARVDLVWQSAWVAAQAEALGLEHLHAHFASLPSTIAYFAHAVTGIPFTFTAHAKDIFVYDLDEHYLRDKLYEASAVITVTEFNRRFLTGQVPSLPPERIRVIHNGIDLGVFKPAPGTKREKDLILSVGRLVPKKGFHLLLEALAHLAATKATFRAVIVGEGSELETLTAQRDALGLKELVHFAGPRNRDEVVDLMHRSAVMCLPCTVGPDNNQDALPTVLLEALATGLPIVSTIVSGIPEIVDSGVDGLLVPPDDARALALELSRLLQEPDLCARFAERGRRKAEEKFDLQKSVAILAGVFRESAAGRRSGAIGAARRLSEMAQAHES